MTNLYIVQETNSKEVIGVYDSLKEAEVEGKKWTNKFIVIHKTLNSPCEKYKQYLQF